MSEIIYEIKPISTIDADGFYHGFFATNFSNGRTWKRAFFDHSNLHGEYLHKGNNGKVLKHSIFIHGDEVYKITKPLTNKYKFILKLKYGEFSFFTSKQRKASACWVPLEEEVP